MIKMVKRRIEKGRRKIERGGKMGLLPVRNKSPEKPVNQLINELFKVKKPTHVAKASIQTKCLTKALQHPMVKLKMNLDRNNNN